MLLHCGTGVGDGVGLGERVGVGVGVAVGHKQFVCDVQLGFLQKPVEQIIPLGQLSDVVQTLLHCGTGVGLGDLVGVGDGVGEGLGERVGVGTGVGCGGLLGGLELGGLVGFGTFWGIQS